MVEWQLPLDVQQWKSVSKTPDPEQQPLESLVRCDRDLLIDSELERYSWS